MARDPQYPQSVLVVGALGFVGSAIVAELMRAGVEVRTTDRVASPKNPPPAYRCADLERHGQILPLLEGVDCVINASGIAHVFRLDAVAAEAMHRVNAVGAGELALAAAQSRVGHLVHLSSVSVYGSPGIPSVDETEPCRPSGPYEQSKCEGERLATEAVNGTSTRLTVLRPATIYGPGDRGNVARLIRAIDRGRFIWVGSGANLKSLIFREDFARACVRAALDKTASGIYNVSAPPVTMRAVVEAAASALGRNIPRICVPGTIARGVAKLAGLSPVARSHASALGRGLIKWLSHDAYDASKFERRFGDIQCLPLKEGIRLEVEWYVAR